jgi:hypothetical protein
MMGTPRPTRMPIRALEATSTRCQRSSPACRFGDLWFHRAVVTSHPTWPPVAHQQRDDHLVSVRSVELSWLLIDQVASARSSLRTAPSGRASLQRSGMPGAAMLSVAGRCPPFGVHPFASDVRGPVSPAVRCPAVRCPISWFRGPGSGRPAGWCPPVRCPAGWCRPRPSGHLRLVHGSPAVALGITSVLRATFTTATDRVARGLRCPSSSVDGLSRPRRGRPVRRRAGERRSRIWPGRARAQAAAALGR